MQFYIGADVPDKLTDWSEPIVHSLLDSYASWRHSGATRDDAVKSALESSVAGPKARRKFLQLIGTDGE